MITAIKSNYIALKTDFDGCFKVTILSYKGTIIFSDNIVSRNKQIILKGFSLKEHTVTLSPLTLTL